LDANDRDNNLVQKDKLCVGTSELYFQLLPLPMCHLGTHAIWVKGLTASKEHFSLIETACRTVQLLHKRDDGTIALFIINMHTHSSS